MIQFTQDFIQSVSEKMATNEYGTTDLFKMMLDYYATQDADFVKMYAKENKSFENCWKYIMLEMEKQAKETKQRQVGTNVFKLFELAFHYYCEDSIDEELKEMEKPKAVVSSAPVVPMQSVVKQPKKESKEPKCVQLSLFD